MSTPKVEGRPAAKGGVRPGAGRPRGPDKATIALEAASRRIFENYKPKGAELTSLEVFQAIYRSNDPGISQAAKMKAAAEALPYEHPKLQAIQHTGDVPGGGAQAALSAIELAREIAFLLRQASEKPK